MLHSHPIILIQEKHVENCLVSSSFLKVFSIENSFFLAQHKGVLQDVAFDGQTLYSFNDLGDVNIDFIK